MLILAPLRLISLDPTQLLRLTCHVPWTLECRAVALPGDLAGWTEQDSGLQSHL